MKLNAEVVGKRCNEIADSLERLERITKTPRDKFLKDRDLQDIASFRLIVAIEAALNLCTHVSAKKLQKTPDEYAQCFGLLAEAGIVPQDLAEDLKNMARFRNRLVHMYWKMDYGIIHDIISKNLDNLRQFSKIITNLL